MITYKYFYGTRDNFRNGKTSEEKKRVFIDLFKSLKEVRSHLIYLIYIRKKKMQRIKKVMLNDA